MEQSCWTKFPLMGEKNKENRVCALEMIEGRAGRTDGTTKPKRSVGVAPQAHLALAKREVERRVRERETNLYLLFCSRVDLRLRR